LRASRLAGTADPEAVRVLTAGGSGGGVGAGFLACSGGRVPSAARSASSGGGAGEATCRALLGGCPAASRAGLASLEGTRNGARLVAAAEGVVKDAATIGARGRVEVRVDTLLGAASVLELAHRLGSTLSLLTERRAAVTAHKRCGVPHASGVTVARTFGRVRGTALTTASLSRRAPCAVRRG